MSEQQQCPSQRLLQLQSETQKREIEMLKRESEMLKRENTELREMCDKLKQSLDEVLSRSAKQTADLGLHPLDSDVEDAIHEPQGLSILISTEKHHIINSWLVSTSIVTFSVCILSYVNDDSSTEGKSDGVADCSGGATVFGRKCTQRIPTVTYVVSCFSLGCSVDISKRCCGSIRHYQLQRVQLSETWHAGLRQTCHDMGKRKILISSTS